MSLNLKLCRFCLSSNVNALSISSAEQKILGNLTGAKIFKKDKKPRKICLVCRSMLRKFDLFCTMIKKSDEHLTALLANKTHGSLPSSRASGENVVHDMRMFLIHNISIIDSVVDEEETSDGDEELETGALVMEPDEPEDIKEDISVVDNLDYLSEFSNVNPANLDSSMADPDNKDISIVYPESGDVYTVSNSGDEKHSIATSDNIDDFIVGTENVDTAATELKEELIIKEKTNEIIINDKVDYGTFSVIHSDNKQIRVASNDNEDDSTIDDGNTLLEERAFTSCRLMRHKTFHARKTTFSCSLCGESFQRKFLLTLHLRQTHVNDHNPRKLRNSNKEKCFKCNLLFKNETEFIKHMIRHKSPQIILRKMELSDLLDLNVNLRVNNKTDKLAKRTSPRLAKLRK